MSIKSFLSLPFANYIVLKNRKWKNNAVNTQNKVLKNLIKSAKKTEFGKDHSFSQIKNYSDLKKQVPIRSYEDLSGYIEKIKKGEENILWPKKPIYFCKTSGTTSGTKYIPISKEPLGKSLALELLSPASLMQSSGSTVYKSFNSPEEYQGISPFQ